MVLKKQTIPWTYQGKEITTPPEEYEGFIYCVYNDTKNMFYIGRKSFYSYSKKKLTLTEKLLPEKLCCERGLVATIFYFTRKQSPSTVDPRNQWRT